MSARFLLGTVLRVRKLREDMAKADAAAAQDAARRAATDHARREAALAGRPEPGSGQAVQWLASRAALLAMANDVAVAREVAVTRSAEGAAALARFAKAQREREGVEDLADRHAEAVRREQEAAEQREADDRAGAAFARAHAEESGVER
jgi:flagellar export protein FliJ